MHGKKSMEVRSFSDIEVRAEDSNGVFSGYIVTWGSVDSYSTSFSKGAFAKTIKERASKVKLLWNHDSEALPIGRVISLAEDEKGVRFEAQLNLESVRGAELYSLMKQDAVNTMSFGFKIIKRGAFKNNVQEINEVALFEISPVNFEANPTATIDDVRATDFSETLSLDDLRRRGWQLIDALQTTLSDIWWSLSDDKIVDAVQKATQDFAGAYTEWAAKIVELRAESGQRGDPDANDLATAMATEIGEKTAVEYAAESPLTLSQVRSLRKGVCVADLSVLQNLPQEVRAAHEAQAGKAADALCEQIKTFGDKDIARIRSVVGVGKQVEKQEQRKEEPSQFVTLLEQTLAEVGELRRRIK